MKKRIIVTTSVVGFHRWPSAPESAGHLAVRHRHLFTVKAEFAVSHDDRDIEFHHAQALLHNALKFWTSSELGVEFGDASCEHIATYLSKLVRVKPSAVEVWEDNENGARIECD